MVQISAGFQQVKIGERGGRRRDFHDSGIHTRQLMEHVKDSKTGNFWLLNKRLFTSRTITILTCTSKTYTVDCYIEFEIEFCPQVFQALPLSWELISCVWYHGQCGLCISTMWTSSQQWSPVAYALLCSTSTRRLWAKRTPLMELFFSSLTDCTTLYVLNDNLGSVSTFVNHCCNQKWQWMWLIKTWFVYRRRSFAVRPGMERKLRSHWHWPMSCLHPLLYACNFTILFSGGNLSSHQNVVFEIMLKTSNPSHFVL